MMEASAAAGERARIVAGFCWKWSDAGPGGSLVHDVVISDWRRPWDAKPEKNKTCRPDKHPYTLWAETDAGRGQVGCIYSAQGFEFDRVGVIWGPDLVWREGRWLAQPKECHDRPVRGSPDMCCLVRNAYCVLLTRGIRGTRLLILDEETRRHVAECIRRAGE